MGARSELLLDVVLMTALIAFLARVHVYVFCFCLVREGPVQGDPVCFLHYYNGHMSVEYVSPYLVLAKLLLSFSSSDQEIKS